MIVAARTDTLILRQLSFGHDLSAAGAFLKNAARHFTLFAGLALIAGFLKIAMGIMRVLRWRHEPICAGAFQDARAFAQRRAGCEDIID
jgi:hypothetical protein